MKSAVQDWPVTQRKSLYRALFTHSCICAEQVCGFSKPHLYFLLIYFYNSNLAFWKTGLKVFPFVLRRLQRDVKVGKPVKS